jgi:RNA-directed DNA polymerase
MTKTNKLSVSKFLSLLSDHSHERALLALTPIPCIYPRHVSEFKIGSKTFFKIKKSPILQQYQDSLKDNFLANIEINNSAIAYVEKKSYLDFFEPHLHSYYFIRLDIKSFFHSISKDLIRDSLSAYISDVDFIENEQKLIDAVINLIMLRTGKDTKNKLLASKTILPIGFKTSPVVSNIIFRRFDILLQAFCSKNRISYTRYADDMLFSSPRDFKFVHTDKFMNEVSYILSLGHFEINKKKTIKFKNNLSLNGYVIESSDIKGLPGTLSISNKKTKIISKLLYKLENNVASKDILKKLFGLSDPKINIGNENLRIEFINNYYNDQLVNVSSGYRAYLISIIKYGLMHGCINKNKIQQYRAMVTRFDKQLLKR